MKKFHLDEKISSKIYFLIFEILKKVEIPDHDIFVIDSLEKGLI